MTWLLRFKNALLAIPAVIGALIAAVAFGRLRGAREARQAAQEKADATQARSRADAAEAAQHHAEVRHEVESETARLPDAPAQTVGDADPGTAAGRLRDDGWTRD
jgi:type II secretory pathway pseudopilin PulG